MLDAGVNFGPSLKDVSKEDWLAEVEDLVDDDGYMARLGDAHYAAFCEHGKTLLVTFETLQGIRALSPLAHPMGWEMIKSKGWSHLGLISDGDTWFRDPAVYAYFDRMVDDGFFDEFDTVLFYGAGPCGYAAAAFSVVAPGARVLAVQPQATLSPGIAPWDQRFTDKRRLCFTDRYGYAPDMLEAASQAYVIYDPAEVEDAMHAALFNLPNVTKLRMRYIGTALQTDLLQMGLLFDLLHAATEGKLDAAGFSKKMRARRDHLPYLRRLLNRVEHQDRPDLTRMLCQNVSTRMRAPRFARRLKSLVSATS
ncbi:MAG: phosphoadenosine phosphosulfate reductase [Roseobacter sp.]